MEEVTKLIGKMIDESDSPMIVWQSAVQHLADKYKTHKTIESDMLEKILDESKLNGNEIRGILELTRLTLDDMILSVEKAKPYKPFSKENNMSSEENK